MSKRPYFFSTVSAADWMEASESRSRARASMSDLLMSPSEVISSTAAWPFARSRLPSRMMWLPLAARRCAAWKPMPWLAPVMRVMSLVDMFAVELVVGMEREIVWRGEERLEFVLDCKGVEMES